MPAATASAPTTDATPGRTAALLVLIRKLIDHGKQLAEALRQQGADALDRHQSWFGTADVALILARIGRGLQLALGLQHRITLDAAKLDAEAAPRRAPARRAPGTPRPPRPAAPQPEAADPRLASLPTPEELALALRRRPIGAVVADICRDLGILPCHPLWRELQTTIIKYSGNFARLVIDILHRPSTFIVFPERWQAVSAPVPAVGSSTGPP